MLGHSAVTIVQPFSNDFCIDINKVYQDSEYAPAANFPNNTLWQASDEEDRELLLRKGVYPYSFAKSAKKT